MDYISFSLEVEIITNAFSYVIHLVWNFKATIFYFKWLENPEISIISTLVIPVPQFIDTDCQSFIDCCFSFSHMPNLTIAEMQVNPRTLNMKRIKRLSLGKVLSDITLCISIFHNYILFLQEYQCHWETFIATFNITQ